MTLPPWTPFVRAERLPDQNLTLEKAQAIADTFGIKVQEVIATYNDVTTNDDIWINSRYQVNIRDLGSDIIHLSIKRLDKDRVGPERYRDFLRIKNELVNPECEAIELYPAMSRNVDTSNQYHLWVFADPTVRIPVGWDRSAMTSESLGNARQHPFDEGDKP
jgi:hypothetical protein